MFKWGKPVPKSSPLTSYTDACTINVCIYAQLLFNQKNSTVGHGSKISTWMAEAGRIQFPSQLREETGTGWGGGTHQGVNVQEAAAACTRRKEAISASETGASFSTVNGKIARYTQLYFDKENFEI